MSKVAMCHCGEPLALTFAFRGYEFFCMTCGRKYTYFGPHGAEETPELLARLEAVKAEYLAVAGAALPATVRLKSCPHCETGGEHRDHATPEELAASDVAYAALAAIRERASA